MRVQTHPKLIHVPAPVVLPVALLAVLPVILLVILTCGGVCAAQSKEPLQSPNGSPVSIANLEGKVVVLAFGGTWVPLFARELLSLQRLANRYESRQVAIYWVSIDSDKPATRNYASNDELLAFLKRSNLKMSVLRDPGMELYHSFDLNAVPTVVILDQKGRLVRRYVGIGTEQGEVYAEIIEQIERLIR